MDYWNKLVALLGYTAFNISVKQLLFAVLIIILSLAVRHLFAHVIVKILKKLTHMTKNDIDNQLVCAIEVPMRLLIAAFGIWLATKQLSLPQGARIIIAKFMISALWFTVFWITYRISDTLSYIFQKFAEKTNRKQNNMLIRFLSKSLKVLIIIFGAITMIQSWGPDITGLITGLGLGGLAFALAAKDTVANLFGSVTVMADRPFDIGDWIMTPNAEGIVEEIGFRSTRIRTFSQGYVTIPNSVMSNDPITNWSKMGKRRITFRLGLTYNTSSEQMKNFVNTVRQMLKNHDEIHPETIFVYFERFGDSALEIFLYFFTKTTNWQKFLEVQEDVNLKIMDIVSEMGLSIAYPSRSIYIENLLSEKSNTSGISD